LAAIDVKTQLVIEQVRLDAKAQADLAAIKAKFMASPAGSLPGASADFDAAAKRQGLDRGARAQPGPLDKLQMANPATIAMKALTSVIETGIKNSKIVQTFTKKVGEALGLLVDLILLPFLPILIWALIGLFKAVLWLGDMWKKFVAASGIDKVGNAAGEFLSDTKQNGEKKTTLDRVLDFSNLLKAWMKFIQIDLPLAILFGLAYLVIEIGKGLWALGTDIGKALADGLWSVMPQFMKDNLKKAQIEFDTALIEIGKWWEGVKKIPEQLDKAWADMLLGLDEFHKMVDKIPQWFEDLGGNISKWFDEQWAILTVELDEIGKAWDVFYSILTSGFKSFVNIFIGLLNMVLNAMRKIPGLNLLVPEGTIPLLAEGGNVSKTGIAVVHAGETVIPAGKGGNTFNFYGYQDDAFIRKVRDVMRSDATRYSQ